MNLLKIFWSRLPLFCAFLALGQAMWGADPVADNVEFNPADIHRVVIELRPLSAKPILPQLPILLEVIVRNPDDVPIVIPDPTLSERDNPYNTLDLFYERDGQSGRPTRIGFALPNFSPFKEGVVPARPRLIRLGANESKSIRVALSHEWQSSGDPQPLTTPGSLRLQAFLCSLARDDSGQRVVNRNERQASQILRVEIVDPPQSEAGAFQKMLSLEHPWLLCAPDAVEHYGIGPDFAKLEGLVAAHPDSVYALYGCGVLAHADVAPNRSPMVVRHTPDPAAGLLLIQRVLADSRYVFRDQATSLKQRLEAQLSGARSNTKK